MCCAPLTIDPLACRVHNGQVVAGAPPNDKIKGTPLPDLLLCDILNVTNMTDGGVMNLRDLWGGGGVEREGGGGGHEDATSDDT